MAQITATVYQPEEDPEEEYQRFKYAVVEAMHINTGISQLQIENSIHPSHQNELYLAALRKRLWKYALMALRLQRWYNFPAYVFAHIQGPPGYQDIPLFRLPPAL